jgi:hypothetical protein
MLPIGRVGCDQRFDSTFALPFVWHPIYVACHDLLSTLKVARGDVLNGEKGSSYQQQRPADDARNVNAVAARPILFVFSCIAPGTLLEARSSKLELDVRDLG